LHPTPAFGGKRHLLALDGVHSRQSADTLLVKFDWIAALTGQSARLLKLAQLTFKAG
jgi:hypothetical protein